MDNTQYTKESKAEKGANAIPNAFIFSVEKGLPFQTKKEWKDGLSAFKELERANAVLQKLVRRIEKRFHDVVWYIGTDIFADGIYERFVFNKGGFMEIRAGSNAGIYAYFNTEKRAQEFKKALQLALKDLG